MIELMHGDCLEKMKEIPDGSVDMVLTSPPYDNLRDYGKDFTGWGDHIWKPCLDQIYRTLKDGGVVVWIVADATIKGSETGTSFRQALYAKEIGFNLHDTMIWNKGKFSAVGALKTRYAPVFEYMFIFTKDKIATFNPIKDRENKKAGQRSSGAIRQKDGSMKPRSTIGKVIAKFGQRFNIWENAPKHGKNAHPAVFPEKLANDHIISWSNTGDIVLDPFMGSGTTGVACVNLSRSFIGIELDDNYFGIAEKRISEAAEG